MIFFQLMLAVVLVFLKPIIPPALEEVMVFSALCTSINGSYSYVPQILQPFQIFFCMFRIVWFYHAILSSVLKLTNYNISGNTTNPVML